MDYYDRDGEKIEISAIYDHGRESQVVVLANVSLEPNNPFAGYPQPYIFTIVKKFSGARRDGDYYLAMDAGGKTVNIRGDMAGYFYDANEYARWAADKHKEEMRRQEVAMDRIRGKLELLKEIMKDQGVRVITNEQARGLGLEV